ncbi:MAG: phosphatase PAP2 family protein, partial [Candidatus Saccharimonadales bacterium]
CAVSAVLTLLLVKLATSLHQDPRPFIRDGVKPYFASSTDNGFPSDHTAFSALIGFVVLGYSRKLGIALVLVSLLIGCTRVISGVHHAQDVIGGFVLAGIAVGLSRLILKSARSFERENQS